MNEEVVTKEKTGLFEKIKYFEKNFVKINTQYFKKRPVLYFFLSMILVIQLVAFEIKFLTLLPINNSFIISVAVIPFLSIISLILSPCLSCLTIHLMDKYINVIDKYLNSVELFSLINNKLAQTQEKFLKEMNESDIEFKDCYNKNKLLFSISTNVILGFICFFWIFLFIFFIKPFGHLIYLLHLNIDVVFIIMLVFQLISLFVFWLISYFLSYKIVKALNKLNKNKG